MADLKARLASATSTAMRAGERDRVKALRLVNAAVKQVEVDQRRDLNDDDIVAVLTRMRKQRRDSLAQFEAAGRMDLAAIERFEIEVIEAFLPQPLSTEELDAAVAAAIAAAGATSVRDMGKVMAALKDGLAGRADMADVSRRVRARLAG